MLRGEYGACPAEVDTKLQARVLDEGEEVITCRPADNLEPELESLKQELLDIANQKEIKLSDGEQQIDDVLTYALFPQVGLKFLENKGNPSAFEPAPTGKAAAVLNDAGEEIYTVSVEGVQYSVSVANGGDISAIAQVGTPSESAPKIIAADGEPVSAPLAGNVIKVLVKAGQVVQEGDSLLIIEAMKMETSISAPRSGTVADIKVQSGDACAVGDSLVTLA